MWKNEVYEQQKRNMHGDKHKNIKTGSMQRRYECIRDNELIEIRKGG